LRPQIAPIIPMMPLDLLHIRLYLHMQI